MLVRGNTNDKYRSTWGLAIKPSSRVYMPVRGNRQEFSAPGWKCASVFPCLGHMLEASGSIVPCFDRVVSACWRAFWKNLSKPVAGQLALSLKMSVFSRCVTSVLTFRLARWPFTISNAKRLNAIQRRMIKIMSPLPRLSGETDVLYNSRCARAVTDIQHSMVPWGVLWASHNVNWASHILRDTAHASWPAKLLHVRSTRQLDLWRSTSVSKRPGTRAESGFVCRRWTDSVNFAIEYLASFKLSNRPYANGTRRLPYKKIHSILDRASQSSTFVKQNIARL